MRIPNSIIGSLTFTDTDPLDLTLISPELSACMRRATFLHCLTNAQLEAYLDVLLAEADNA